MVNVANLDPKLFFRTEIEKCLISSSNFDIQKSTKSGGSTGLLII